jgi:hypothetical protein
VTPRYSLVASAPLTARRSARRSTHSYTIGRITILIGRVTSPPTTTIGTHGLEEEFRYALAMRSVDLGCSRLTIEPDPRGLGMLARVRFVRDAGASKRVTHVAQGAILVAGSLQPLWPAAPMAATLNQYFAPRVRPLIIVEDVVTTFSCTHEVSVGGSALRSIT